MINKIIPEKHVPSIINGELYFSPCKSFVDLLEFRFAYCWEAFQLASAHGRPEIFGKCIRRSFSDEKVQKTIEDASISCWAKQPERPFMWEVYGQSKPAIMLTMREDEFERYVKRHKGDCAAIGPVTYHFNPSNTEPPFVNPATHPDYRKHYNLFFHKHEFYEFENEFRAAIFGPGRVILPLEDQLVKGITLSPLASLSPSLVEGLKERFGNRVQESKLRWN
jgi:hypothetical protein